MSSKVILNFKLYENSLDVRKQNDIHKKLGLHSKFACELISKQAYANAYSFSGL